MTALDLAQDAAVLAIFLLVAFPVHEFSHAWTAFRLGDSTARWQGRLTLNPIVHFDPIGGSLLAISIVLAGFGIGWAKPTPVNPYNLRYGRKGEALVAVAGPISNLVMAAIVAIPLRIIASNPSMLETVRSSDISVFVLNVAYLFVQIDVLLMIFNLLPIPPLDGWRALLGLVDARTAYNLKPFEQYGFVVLILIIFIAPTFIGQLAQTITTFLVGA
ncbi:MAG TPA: site-2 protease family protein [Candidatus Limnocylindrales bacterium]